MAIIYAIAGNIFFIVMFTCVGLMRKGYSTFQIIQGRMCIGIILNYLFCYIQNIPIFPKNYTELKLMALRGILGAIVMLLAFTSYKLLTLSDAVVVTNTTPLFTCFLSVPYLGEQLTKKQIFYSLLSFIGIVLVVRPAFLFGVKVVEIEGRNQLLGCLLGLLSSFLMSFVLIIQRKVQFQMKINNAQLLMFSHYITPLFSGLAQLQSPFNEFKVNQFYFILITIIGLSGFIAQMFQSRSYTLEQASIITPLSYTQVIMSFFVDIFLFNEQIYLTSLIGSFLVIFGSIAILV
ncbi:hypothetical protein ABPG74_001187 [Tetrahymena malaccensis]